MNSSQALSSASRSRFIREYFLKNGVGLGIADGIIEAFPGFLKLKQFARDLFLEMACRIFRIFDKALQYKGGAQQPFALTFILRKLFR